MTLFYEMAALITARPYTRAALSLGLQLAAHAVQLAVLPRGAECARVATLFSTLSLVKTTITLLTFFHNFVATESPQTTKPSSATPKAPSSRPATTGTTKAPTTARTPLSTRTTPLTRPSPVPSTLRPRPTSTSRLRAASATRKAQAASATNGTSKTPLITSKTTTTRTPLSRPSP